MALQVRRGLVALILIGTVVAGCDHNKNTSTGTGSTGGGSTPTSPSPPTEPPAPPPTPPLTCTYAVAASPNDFALEGGSGVLTIATAAGCKWTVKSDATWAAIEGPTEGDGNATLKLTVAINDDADARKATLTVQDKTAIVTQPGQSGCTYSVSPVDKYAPPLVASSEEISITTSQGCAWTGSSDSSWARLRHTSGHGSARVTVDVDANLNTTTNQRTAVLAFRWLAPTAGQNVRIFQYGRCFLGVYPATGGMPTDATSTGTPQNRTITASAAGGRFHLWVLTEPWMGCSWMLDGGDSWVQSLAPAPGKSVFGDGDIFFTLPGNPTSQTRSTTLILGAATPVTIVQKGS